MKARITIGLPENSLTKETDIDPKKSIEAQIAEIAKRMFFTESAIKENKTAMLPDDDPANVIRVIRHCNVPNYRGFVLIESRPIFVLGNWAILYGCGHEAKVIFLDNNLLSITAWLEWNETTGPEGDSSQCWDCFCEEQNRNRQKQ